MTGVARNGLRIDERVQDNVRKRAHSPEGVRRPETDVCARIRGARASFMGVNEIGSCRVEAESILSLKLHLQSAGLYIGNGDG